MEESKYVKKHPTPLKLIELVLILIAAWIIFSINGFLPRIISAPVAPEKQKYTHIFQQTGYSFSHFVKDFIKVEEITDPDNIIDVLNGNIMVDSQVFYDNNTGLHYLLYKGNFYSYDVGNKKGQKIANSLPDNSSIVIHNNSFISTQSGGYSTKLINAMPTDEIKGDIKNKNNLNIYTNYYDKEKKQRVTLYNYKRLTYLASGQKASFRDICDLITAKDCGIIDGYFPNEKKAVFETFNNNSWSFHICDIDGNESNYGPYPIESDERMIVISASKCLVWKPSKPNNAFYIWDFVTDEVTHLIDTYEISTLIVRVKDSGAVSFAGLCYGKYNETNKNILWLYDGDKNQERTVTLGELSEDNYLSLGERSYALFSCNPRDIDNMTVFCDNLDNIFGGNDDNEEVLK